jgi:hypothetical protein
MAFSYQSIKSYLTRFYKKQPEQSKDKDLEKASVLFNLDISGNIDVQFLWPDTEVMTSLESKDLAKNYSALISIINLGGFKADILKILMQSQKQTSCISDKTFISDVLKYLVDADNISSTSLPLISPTKVFKKYE